MELALALSCANAGGKSEKAAAMASAAKKEVISIDSDTDEDESNNQSSLSNGGYAYDKAMELALALSCANAGGKSEKAAATTSTSASVYSNNVDSDDAAEDETKPPHKPMSKDSITVEMLEEHTGVLTDEQWEELFARVDGLHRELDEELDDGEDVDEGKCADCEYVILFRYNCYEGSCLTLFLFRFFGYSSGYDASHLCALFFGRSYHKCGKPCACNPA